VGGGVQLGPLGTAATNRPIVPAPGDYDGEIGGMIGSGNRSTREKTCPSAVLSTTIPTCCPDGNPGRRSGKPATNRLSYGTALLWGSGWLSIGAVCVLLVSRHVIVFSLCLCSLYLESWMRCTAFQNWATN
jgi:hypothetical protein